MTSSSPMIAGLPLEREWRRRMTTEKVALIASTASRMKKIKMTKREQYACDTSHHCNFLMAEVVSPDSHEIYGIETLDEATRGEALVARCTL